MPYSKKRYSWRTKRYGRRRLGYSRRFRRTGKRSFLPKGRRAKSGKFYTSINRSLGMFPDVTYVKLKFCENVQFIFSNISYVNMRFNANSLYSPDPGLGTAAQPYGFDQWNQMYRNYLVLGNAIKCKFLIDPGTYSNITSTTQESIKAIIAPSLTTSSPYADFGNSVAYLREYPRAHSGEGTRASHNPFTITNYQQTGTLFGLTTRQIKDDPITFGAIVGANPAQMNYWHVLAYSSSNSAITTTVDVSIEMIYYVRFWDRATPGLS